MKSSFYIIAFLCLIFSCKGYQKDKAKVAGSALISRNGELPGNNIVEWVHNCPKENGDSGSFIDPVDDTINYKRVSEDIFKDTLDKIYVLSTYQDEKYLGTDTTLLVNYFQDVSEQIDLKTYRTISNKGYFTTRGKVYLWWGDMQHSYLVEVTGADPHSFQPFDSLAGGIDKDHVFYGGPPSNFEIIEGANPKTIKILNPKRGCWNCGNCYFTDDKSVFFGLIRIQGADPQTFKLLNEETVDAQDKNHKYFDGKVVK